MGATAFSPVFVANLVQREPDGGVDLGFLRTSLTNRPLTDPCTGPQVTDLPIEMMLIVLASDGGVVPGQYTAVPPTPNLVAVRGRLTSTTQPPDLLSTSGSLTLDTIDPLRVEGSFSFMLEPLAAPGRTTTKLDGHFSGPLVVCP